MRRREFITLLGGAATDVAMPRIARAEQAGRMRRIGVLTPSTESDADARANLAAFRNALDGLGWKEGKTVQFEYRWTNGDNKLVLAYAKELVAMSPDAILTQSVQLVRALRDETRTIPIVFGAASDPVEVKLVDSLAKPGGNITGFTSIEGVSNIKLLELLKELDPRIARVGVLLSPDNPSSVGRFGGIVAGGAVLKVDVVKLEVATPADIERAVDAFAGKLDAALIILPSTVTVTYRKMIIDAVARRRLPAVHPLRYYVDDGGLMSYGHDTRDQFRRAASYVDRILRGEKPGDLPIQAPTKFSLVINLKTAKALGIAIPPLLIGRADEVIE